MGNINIVNIFKFYFQIKPILYLYYKYNIYYMYNNIKGSILINARTIYTGVYLYIQICIKRHTYRLQLLSGMQHMLNA